MKVFSFEELEAHDKDYTFLIDFADAEKHSVFWDTFDSFIEAWELFWEEYACFEDYKIWVCERKKMVWGSIDRKNYKRNGWKNYKRIGYLDPEQIETTKRVSAEALGQ